MKRTRVLLSVEQQLQAQLLKHLLASRCDIELVGETTNVIECLVLIAAKKPHLWIHSWEEGADLQHLLSHVYSSHPNLTVVRIAPNESAGFMQIQIDSLAGLLRVATQSRQWATSA